MKNLFKINNDDLKFINKNYLKSRIFVLIIFFMAAILISKLTNESLHSYFYNHKFFDVEHYSNIAKNGYTDNFLYAFFPLFPLVMRIFYNFKIMILGTIMFNLLLGYFSTILIYKILDLYNYNDFNKRSLLKLWFYSPITLFIIIPYTEGLFIFLTLLAFYMYITKKNYFINGIIIGLSVLTRSFGAMLFFAIFIDWIIKVFKEKRDLKSEFKNICLMYIPATIISLLYPVYLYIKTGNLFYFIDVQYIYWFRKKSNFIKALYIEFDMLFKSTDAILIMLKILNICLLLFSIYLIIKVIFSFIKNKQKGYITLIVYVILCFISAFSTMRSDGINFPTCSIYRYFLGMFPIYLMDMNLNENDIFANTLILLFKVFNVIVVTVFAFDIFLC